MIALVLTFHCNSQFQQSAHNTKQREKNVFSPLIDNIHLRFHFDFNFYYFVLFFPFLVFFSSFLICSLDLTRRILEIIVCVLLRCVNDVVINAFALVVFHITGY